MSLEITNPGVVAALIAASAALGAALFAFAAALINARVARQNAVLQSLIAQRMKRAEFRQAWINDLRDAFMKIQVAFMLPELDRQGAENSIKTLLLMNRTDPDYERLRNCIFTMTDRKAHQQDTIDKVRREFITVAQDILKREWEVTKGEINHLEGDVRAATLRKSEPTTSAEAAPPSN